METVKRLLLENDTQSLIQFIERDERILNNGGDILLLSASIGNLEMIQYLLQKGIDINFIDFLGRNAVYMSVLHNDYDTTMFLLKIGGNPQPPNLKSPLSLTLYNPVNYEMFILLTQFGADINWINGEGWASIIHIFADPNNDDYDKLKFILDLGFDPDLPLTIEGASLTVFTYFVFKQYPIRYIKLLVDYGANVFTAYRVGENTISSFELSFVVGNNVSLSKQYFKYFIQLDIMSPELYRNVLSYILLNYNNIAFSEWMFKAILRYGNNVNLELPINDQRTTLLMFVSNAGYFNLVLELLRYDAKMYTIDSLGKTASDYALESNHMEIYDLLTQGFMASKLK